VREQPDSLERVAHVPPQLDRVGLVHVPPADDDLPRGAGFG